MNIINNTIKACDCPLSEFRSEERHEYNIKQPQISRYPKDRGDQRFTENKVNQIKF